VTLTCTAIMTADGARPSSANVCVLSSSVKYLLGNVVDSDTSEPNDFINIEQILSVNIYVYLIQSKCDSHIVIQPFSSTWNF